MADAMIDSLSIEIDVSSDNAVKKMSKIIDALKATKQATADSGLDTILEKIKAIGTVSEQAEHKVSRLLNKIRELNLNVKNDASLNVKQLFSESGGALQGWDSEKLMNMGEYEELDRRLGILMTKMEEAAAKGNDLQAMDLARQANKIQAQLTALENSANQTASRFDVLRDSIKRAADNSLVTGFKHLQSAFKRIVLYRAIRAGLNYISNGFREGLASAYEFSKAVGGDLAYSIDRLSNAGTKLKNQLGAAFGSLIQAAEPILMRLIELAIMAADALSQLLAVLSGKNIYKKAQTQTKQLNKDIKSTTESAKELNRQIMGFDEINRLNALGNNSGSPSDIEDIGGILDDFDYSEISDFWKKIADLFSSLKLSIKDVFFDWKNLNAEQIAEKAVAGLCGLLGGVTGFMLGGVPGAIVGTLTGVGIGLLINSVIFNHDGVLSNGEIANMLSGALYGIAGGVVGFFAGGPAGALIGASVGIGLFASLKTVDFVSDGQYSNIIDQLATALTALTGAMIGFVVGGPAGAVLGAVVGIGVSGVINSLKFDIKDEKYNEYKNGMSWFICGVLGLPSDEEWSNWGKNVIEWIGEGFSGFGTELHWLIADPIERMMKNIKQYVRGKLDEIKKLFNVTWSFPKIKMPHFSWTWQNVGKWVSIPKISVAWYANGGFPEDGLFMANHGELVGKFANGKTAVANNEQITNGIAEAVYGAFVRAFTETGGAGSGSSGPHVAVFQVNGKEFARATFDDQRAVAKEKGMSLIANFA
ncbi:MAG: hypothetical protein K6C12_12030 [Oscillospiraceae bacterium]|nr:hypothetical protein [Oscillospiraceae bacterium]